MVPDYYAMLGVEFKADRATIEAALAKCQPAWSSGTRNPKTKHTHQSYLDQIPSIRQALLGDKPARSKYDAELLAALRAERETKLDLLQKKIRLRAAKGGLTVGDRSVLRDEAEKIGLSVDDLNRLVEPIPPMPEAPAGLDDAPEPAPDVLDPVMRRQARMALDHLHKRDLYDALGLPRDAPGSEIAVRADAERRKWMKKTQVTAEKTAWLEVITLAQSHLTSPHDRSRYNRTLAFEAEERLTAAITFALGGLSRLDPGTRQALADEADALGVAPDRAETILSRACRRLGVSREGVAFATITGPSGAHRPSRLLRCRSCSGVTDHASLGRGGVAAVCRHCGASLHWSCPVCQRMMWVDEPRCSCGFRVELREPLVAHFEAAQQAFKVHDYAAAFENLRRVRELAPKHVGARKGLEMVKRKAEEIDTARAAYEIARAGGKFVAAHHALDAWSRLIDPSTPDYVTARRVVNETLREAQGLAARARSRERTDPRSARDLYRRSLSLAADLPDALVGLDRCPPDAPTLLTADYARGRVRLRWTPPPPDELGPVSFVVLRKADSPLKHPADGVRIGESARPEFDDADVTPGTSVAYAVLSRRGTVESITAVAVGPIFLLGEVADVQVEVRSREVDLLWTPPTHAIEVRVARKRGSPPKDPTDGEYVESTLDQAHDRGLQSDRVYQYGIFAVFRTPDGRSTASRGVFLSATPHTPVRPLDPPTLTVEPDGRLAIRWVEPARGIVKLIRTPGPFPHPVGTRLGPAQVGALEGQFVAVDAADVAYDRPPPFGALYYTPLVSWGGIATVGGTAAHSSVSDPADLRATPAGGSGGGNGRVNLRWRWSPHGSQSIILARRGTPPTGVDDPEAISETVHEIDYHRLGHHPLTLPPGDLGPWHVAVHALTVVDGHPVTSPGVEPTSKTVVLAPNQEVTLNYRFERRRLTGRRSLVSYRTEPEGSPLPATVLVAHPRTVPLSAEDGTIVAEFPPSRDGATFTVPPGLNLGKMRARVFADPRVAPDTQTRVRVLHPDSGMTRV